MKYSNPALHLQAESMWILRRNMRGRGGQGSRREHQRLGANGLVRPHRAQRDFRRHHRSGVRVHKGTKEHALAHHGALPVHASDLIGYR